VIVAHRAATTRSGHDPIEELRGARDQVAMLVTDRAARTHRDAAFRDLPSYLAPGDALVVNVSATIAASLDARSAGGEEVRLHVARRLSPTDAIVEPRAVHGWGTRKLSVPVARPLTLVAGGSVRFPDEGDATARLRRARFEIETTLDRYLARHGGPIRYEASRPWPLDRYQTVYAVEPGSAEMPSAGRPFTAETITRLVALGVDVVPVVLHAGLSSYEAGEAPPPEPCRVPGPSVARIEAARAGGGRVVAVGTTVVRALETAAMSGELQPFDGMTDLLIGPERGVAIVDALLTGLHEPESSHLEMLRAFADDALLNEAYDCAASLGYAWHEFGDVHLLLARVDI
jgi:S-adenosylmethionine:tRNA ribosyltransferase-isomerase